MYSFHSSTYYSNSAIGRLGISLGVTAFRLVVRCLILILTSSIPSHYHSVSACNSLGEVLLPWHWFRSCSPLVESMSDEVNSVTLRRHFGLGLLGLILSLLSFILSFTSLILVVSSLILVVTAFRLRCTGWSPSSGGSRPCSRAPVPLATYQDPNAPAPALDAQVKVSVVQVSAYHSFLWVCNTYRSVCPVPVQALHSLVSI